MGKGTQTKQIKRRVISHLNTPARLPVIPTMIIIMWYRIWPPRDALDQIAFGIVIAILFMMWVSSIYSMAIEKQVNIFEDTSTFETKLKVNLDDTDSIYEDIQRKSKDKLEG